METEDDVVMLLRPSLRRAYFYSFLYVAAVTFARVKLDLEINDPLVAGAMGLLVLLLAYAHLARAFMVYTLTPAHVNVHTGVIARKSNRIPLDRITDATSQQSVLERCLGIANIYIDTAGSSDSEACLFRILKSEAKEFAARFKELKRAAPQTA